MNSGLDDLVTVIEWLSESKTAPPRVAEAMARLKQRTLDRIPTDVRLDPIASTENKRMPDVLDLRMPNE